MEEKKESWWNRIRRPYRLSIMDENTWTSVWGFQLTGLGAFTLFTLLFILTLVLFSLAIIYTPIKNILPGYSENIRQQLVVTNGKVDSLQTEMALQTQYLDVLKKVASGQTATDTMQPLDSMQMVMREQLLKAQSEATEEFMAQYEEKEKDNFQLFDIQNVQPTYTLFRPAHGVVMERFSMEDNHYGILLRTIENENITAVLAGTVVYECYEIDNTYSLVVQHDNYVSTYRYIGRVLKHAGDEVKAGESLGIVGDETKLYFELWQNGKPQNPEEVIVF